MNPNKVMALVPSPKDSNSKKDKKDSTAQLNITNSSLT